MLDAAGNRTNEIDARGVVTIRTFDKLNRVTSESFPASPGENITYTYDATNGGNFGIGRLTGYADETGSTVLTYNERGDVVSEVRTIGSKAYTTAYAYDLADRIIGITYPSGHTISYIRDAIGRVARVNFGATPDSPALAGSFAYLPFGLLNSFTYGNGLVHAVSYDKDYRVIGVETFSTTNIQWLQFGYDAANDIISITDHANAAFNQQFSYDADYRLTNAAGIYGSVGYSYDANGNRLTRFTAKGTEQYSYPLTANVLQSITGPDFTRSFGYTNNGNMNSDSRGTGLTFNYGNRNRYNTLTVGGNIAATYKYNAVGERLVKTAGGVITHYHYDRKGHLIAESQADGTVIREYVWLDDMPLAQIEGNGTIYYIHPDNLNRPQKMTDAFGAVVWDNEQQPFGENLQVIAAGPIPTTNGQFQVTASGGPNTSYIIQTATNLSTGVWISIATNSTSFAASGTFTSAGSRFYRVLAQEGGNDITNNLRFPGQYYDAESGLNYNVNRDYDATHGRFIQNDPVGMSAGLNLYVYALQNPVNEIDPYGNISLPSFGDWLKGQLRGALTTMFPQLGGPGYCPVPDDQNRSDDTSKSSGPKSEPPSEQPPQAPQDDTGNIMPDQDIRDLGSGGLEQGNNSLAPQVNPNATVPSGADPRFGGQTPNFDPLTKEKEDQALQQLLKNLKPK